MKKHILILTGFFIGIASYAQQSTPLIDQRQCNQKQRIVEGRIEGSINPTEAYLLNKQQRNIKRTERRALSDGVVTRREQYIMNRKQNKAGRSIRKARNNAF